MQNLETYYFRFTDIWKKFCELHNELFFLSLDEYSLLLSSDLDALDLKLTEKKELIDSITALEKLRAECFEEIRSNVPNGQSLNSFRDVFKLFQENIVEEKNQKHLERFNALLVDLIEKIKSQNKKTQIFINKAVHSLQTIREEAMGVKPNSLYNNKGVATKTLVT